MKKFLLTILALSLVIIGVWWMARRQPGGPPPEGDPAAFNVERSGKGVLLQYQNSQMPLRFIRWLRPLPDGVQIAQVVTQNDRQQIAWFEDGVLQGVRTVPRPQGVREGFFNFAELQDACLWPGNALVLLYRSSAPDSDELPLVVALDLVTRDIRWVHRARGLRLARTPDSKDEAVYLFGPKDPIVRLPLATLKTEQPSQTGIRTAAHLIELPSEIQLVEDILPLGAWTFLLAHRGGLSTYLGVKGWTHQPMPALPPVVFPGAPSRLVQAKNLWWQPQPGLLVQLHTDGTVKQTWTPNELSTSDPFVKDGLLLHLLGADASGRLWFDLATPAAPPIPAPVATSAAPQEETEEASSSQQAPTAVDLELSTELSGYASQGISRLYLWNPEDHILKRLSWKDALSTMQVPQGIAIPAVLPDIRPESGALLFNSGTSAWWLPLSTLSFGDPSITDKPSDQPR